MSQLIQEKQVSERRLVGVSSARDFFGEIGPRGLPEPLSDEIALGDASAMRADGMAVALPTYGAGYLVAKRFIDVVGALLGLAVLGPAMLAAMVAVWFQDRGNPIFRQTRVGLDGREFTLLKIRTMCVDAEARFEEIRHLNQHDDDRTFKCQRDPRILPRIGEFLRRFSIDEFPQLINVLRGEMSLVGPRPALPHEVAKYDEVDRLRLTVKPGLTCTWQVVGRGELDFSEQLKLDLQYIEGSSIGVDLKLIVLTVPALLAARGAH